jgi:hypothetical protein
LRAPIDLHALAPITGARLALVAMWAAAVLAALGALTVYKLEPGRPAELRERWPAGSSLTASAGRPTLVMFAHPRCPCTRASLAELRALLSRFSRHMTTHVIFMRPSGSAADWSRTDTWATASSLAGVRVAADVDGREAALFGATTSGHVVFYDTSGRLLFSGGITPARGHQGDSPQLDQLRRLIERETAVAAAAGAAPSAPPHERPGAVYGCPLGEETPTP